MLPSLNRREVAGASLTALMMGTVPAIAAPLTPIEDAFHQLARLYAAMKETRVVLEAAEGRYVEPEPIPYRLAYHEGGFASWYHEDGRHTLRLDTSEDAIADLQVIIDAPFVGEIINDGTGNKLCKSRICYDRHQQRARRAKRDLNAILDWRAEDQRRSDAAGVPEAEAAFDAAAEAYFNCLDGLFELEPETIRDLAFQSAALGYFRIPDDVAHHGRSIANRLCALSGVLPVKI